MPSQKGRADGFVSEKNAPVMKSPCARGAGAPGSVPRHAAVRADHARRRRKQAPTTPRTSWMERCCTRTAVPVKATTAHTASPMSEPTWTRKADQKPRDRYGRCTLVHSPPYRAPRLLPANHEGQWAMPVSTRAGRVHHVVMMVRWNVQ